MFGIDKIVFQVDPKLEEYEFLIRYGLELKPGSHLGVHYLSEPENVENFRFTYSSFDNF